MKTKELTLIKAENKEEITIKSNQSEDIIIHLVAQQDTASTLTFIVEENATLNLLMLQSGNKTAINSVQNLFRLEKNSKLNATWLSKENLEITQKINLEFRGEDIQASLSGLSWLRGSQKITTHTHLQHFVPNTTASQLFKNIITDHAQAEYQGLVHVKDIAQKTDSNQYTHNLILSDHGRAYAKPQLEIFADDVKCSHGASIGQLNEDQLFYLESRGFSQEQARQILLTGFAEEIIDLIQVKTEKQKLINQFL